MNKIIPPIAKEIEKILEKHGDKRIDNYYWLNEKENPEVISYLEAENEYLEKIMSPTKDLQKELFDEMKARIKEDDESVPYFLNNYWYLATYKMGNEYPIYSRKYKSLENKEEILFNVNILAKGYDYYQLGSINISPNNKLASYSEDTVSRRIFTIKVKNLQTGRLLYDTIENTTGSVAWAADNKTFFYTTQDSTTLRANKVFKHKLGDSQASDVLVYEEKDKTFSCNVSVSKSKDYIFISCSNTLSTEQRFININEPDSTFKILHKREEGLEYSASHYKGNFYILTNADGATNFKLMVTPTAKTDKENWKELIPHHKETLLEGVEIFKDFLVIEERSNGNLKLKIIPWKEEEKAYYLPIAEEVYTVYTSTNLEFNTTKLRYVYTSLTTPTQVLDFDMVTKKNELKKEQEIMDSKFDKKNYLSEKIWVTTNHGEKVAMSLVKRVDTKLNEKTPLLLYGYGSYGHTVDPTFSSTRLSLLDRGFVFVIAHIRGGEYLGRKWYDDGKMLKKKNTFHDFIACAEHLIKNNYTSSKNLYAQGGSAGGLLMGAIVNMAPNLFKGIISNVPFVDVLTTMLDDSIPLTTGEYDEWGNPNEKEYYKYIKEYSPYDNIEAKTYPNILITTGLHDSQVQYWEPAKYVAKLRKHKKGDNLILMKTEMKAGHGGASGRFEPLYEEAMEQAFLLSGII